MNKKKVFIWFIIYLSFLIIFSIIFSLLPHFSDSTYNIMILRHMIKEGRWLPTDSGIWQDFFINPPSTPSVPYHPPFFYTFIIIIYRLLLGKISFEIILNIVSALFIPTTALLIYLIGKELKLNNKILNISVFITLFTPMLWWIAAHRVAEILVFPEILLFLLLYIKNSYKLSIKLAILLWIISFTKISGLFFAGGVLTIYTLKTIMPIIKNKQSLNFTKLKQDIVSIGIFMFLFIFLEISYVYPLTGSIYFMPHKLPIIDSTIFNPKKFAERKDWDIQLDSLTRYYVDRFDENSANLPYLYEYIKHLDISILLQIFQPLRVVPYEHRSYYHWFGIHSLYSELIISLIFIFGIYNIILQSKYNKLEQFLKQFYLFSFLCLITYIKLGIFRYLFFINLMGTFIISTGINESIKKFRNFKFLADSTILVFITILLIIQNYYTITDIISYRYSLNHIPFKGSKYNYHYAFKDLKKLNDINEVKSSDKIFTPLREVAYYTNKDIVYDSRLLHLNVEDINYYIRNYDTSIIILPNFGFDKTLLQKMPIEKIKELDTISVYKIINFNDNEKTK